MGDKKIELIMELISIADLCANLSKKIAEFSASFETLESRLTLHKFVRKIVTGQLSEDQLKQSVRKLMLLLTTEGGDYESLVIKVLDEDGSGVKKTSILPSNNQMKIEPAVLPSNNQMKIEPAVLQSQIQPSSLSNWKKRSADNLHEGNISDNVSTAPKKLRIHKPEEKVVDNIYEARLLSHVVPPNKIDVTLEDIGALEETRSFIQGLVIAPITSPQLFKSSLLHHFKDILLFGPPGTGKKMLAKAIARDCGANLINVPSTYFNDKTVNREEHVKALFNLATKIAPSVIFIDQIDTILGKRSGQFLSRYQNSDFLSVWDSLRAEAKENVIVLGATVRPFDLDLAVIKKFERRIFVDLPCKQNRESILRKILAKENVNDIDYKQIAAITDGYSGSDLKELCAAAAYQPLVDLLKQQRSAPVAESEIPREVPILRSINMNDMRQAKNKVSPKSLKNGPSREDLMKWNDLYGEK